MCIGGRNQEAGASLNFLGPLFLVIMGKQVGLGYSYFENVVVDLVPHCQIGFGDDVFLGSTNQCLFR